MLTLADFTDLLSCVARASSYHKLDTKSRTEGKANSLGKKLEN